MKHIFSRPAGLVTGIVASWLAWIGPSPATATGILYQFNNVFSYSAAESSPAGPAPWIDVSFQDVANGVQLTINNPGLTGGEFVSGLYLNFNPFDTVNDLTFVFMSGTAGVMVPTIQTGEDAYRAGGGGKYGILFSFCVSKSGRFGTGDSLTYRLGGIAGLSSADFEYQSAPAGGTGPFYAAAHVQGIADATGTDSVWMDPELGPQIMPVPEPASAALLVAAGLSGVAFLRLRDLKLKPVRTTPRSSGALARRRMVNFQSR